MSDYKAEELTTRLVSECGALEQALKTFQDINEKAHFIALIAAIEGARMKGVGTFTIVAGQIANQAAKNSALSEQLNKLVEKIKTQALEAIAVRNLELSTDLIDKLDRNLFERNCDCQAWASFDIVKSSCIENNNEVVEAACAQLESLVNTYVLYFDSLLLNSSGKVVAAAKDRALLGQFMNSLPLFEETLKGSVVVSDLHYDEIVKKHTVCYCAPVFAADGKEVQGVLINFFNWSYALEMIESGEYSSNTKAVFMNREAQVIGSLAQQQILKDSYDWLRAGDLAMGKKAGYSIERSRNGEPIANGFCFTKGYNAYRGKGWSAIFCETLPPVKLEQNISHATQTINDDGTILSLGDSDSKIESERACKKLVDTMKEIDDLVYQINANNCEVKLLAVNASIQAGLAGSEGEGFSIIANEVANLAKKSLDFVSSVNVTTNNLREAVESSSYVRLVDAAKDTMSKVDRNLFERFCDIQAFATFSKFIEILKTGASADEETFSLLEKVHKIYEVYHDIFLLNPRGQLVAAAINRSLVGQDFSHTDWFRAGQASSVYYSDIYYSETLKTPVISYTSTILGDNNEVIGYIATKFNCQFLNDIMKATIIDSVSETYLVNLQGQVIASKNPENVLAKKVDNPLVVNNFQKGNSGLSEWETKGKTNKAYLGFSSSHGYNTYQGQKWTVVAYKDQQLGAKANILTPAEKFNQKLGRTG